MRLLMPVVAFAALAFATNASAVPISLEPVEISTEFQTELEEEFGVREGEFLRGYVVRALESALTREGASLGADASWTVETTIVDAAPNKPTMQQLSLTPGLDYARSLSVGGAELVGVLRRDGQVVAEVHHRRYPTFDMANFAGGPWADARSAVRQFANKVADAYAENAN